MPVARAPTSNMMDPYSTTYSTSHNFQKNDISFNTATRAFPCEPTKYQYPNLPSSGYIHGNNRTATANLQKRYCGDALSQEFIERNEIPNPLVPTYEALMHHPDTGITSRTFVPIHNKRDLSTLEKIEQKGGGYNRNQAFKQNGQAVFHNSTSESSRQYTHIPQPFEEFRKNNPPWTLRKTGNGYIKNMQPVRFDKLNEAQVKDWMTTTNAMQQEASNAAYADTQRDLQTARIGKYEASAFSRGIMEPPAEGVGTDHMKLYSNTRPNSAPKAGLPFNSEAQAYYNMSKMKKPDPTNYKYNMMNADPWTTTTDISRKDNDAWVKRDVPTLPGHAAKNGLPSKLQGKYFQKDLTSMYSTTKDIDNRYISTAYASVANAPKESRPVQHNSGFSSNNKTLIHKIGEGAGPAQDPIPGGYDFPSGERAGSEKGAYLCTSRNFGTGVAEANSKALPPFDIIKRDFTNKSYVCQSGFGRESQDPPLPLQTLRGGRFSIPNQ